MASLDLGLRIECDPLVRDKFSRHVAQPQPDRPAQTVQPGFAFYDEPAQKQKADPIGVRPLLNARECECPRRQVSDFLHPIHKRLQPPRP
jgi:hypothetical protein